MKIEELATEAGVTVRHVRDLVSQGLVPRPRGSRSRPAWGLVHVQAICRYQTLRAARISRAEIRSLPERTDDLPFSVAPGVTLLLAPKLLGSGAEMAPIRDELERLLRRVL